MEIAVADEILPAKSYDKIRSKDSVIVDSDIQDAVRSRETSPRPVAQMDIEAIQPRNKLRIVTVMGALYATICIVALNSTIVATAIPTICSQLNSASGYAWIGGAYLLANAASAPIWVKLSDIWGRKPIVLSGVSLYFVTSIVCATSVSMKMLIIGRACQGIAGGGLFQLVNVTISDLFSMKDRSLYFGFLGLIWAVAGASGPILGGLFTNYLSWRWIFWINLPICGTAFLLLFHFLDVHNPRTPLVLGIKAIDWFGSIAILGLMVMVLLGLDFGGAAFPWKSPVVIGLIIAGLCMGAFFLWSQKNLARYPLMPLGIFKSRSNVACLLIAFFHDFVYIATEYYLPLFFQSVLLASPLRSGTLLLPIIVTESTTQVLSSIITHRTGVYLPQVYIGAIFLVIGTSLYTRLSPMSNIISIVAFEVVAGLGTGLLFTPPLLALQAHVKQEHIATATSTIGFMKNLSTCLSVVLGGVVFQNGMEGQVQELKNAGLDKNIVSLLTNGEAAANVMIIGTIEDPQKLMAVKAAYAGSLRNIWIICAAMSGAAVLCSLMVQRKELSDVHVEYRTGLRDVKNESEQAGGNGGVVVE